MNRKPTPFPSEPAVPSLVHTQLIPKMDNLREENTNLRKRVAELEAEVAELRKATRITFK